VKIRIARKAGFCMGVRRAVNLVLRAISQRARPIYTYGPLIHNPQTLKLLEKLGVSIIKKPDAEVPSGVCVIRAHGISPEEKSILSKRHRVIDGTCPRVLRVQALAKRAAREGKWVIIIGDKNHAEVKGILAHAREKGIVVSDEKDLEQLPKLDKYVILSQTTQDQKKFEKLSEEILGLYPGGKVINTICNATDRRQSEVRGLAKECDAIIVIGGKFSANTNRLAQIAESENKPVFLVENPEELNLDSIKNFQKLGITAGASTPNWLINELVDYIKSSFSIAYRVLKAFSFLSFLFAFNFFLLFSGLLNFVHYPLNASRIWFSSFVFFFLLFRYNLLTWSGHKELYYYYSVKAKSVKKHEKLIKFLIVFSGIASVVSGLMFNPRILGVMIGLIFLDQVIKRSPLSFLWEVTFLGAIGLYLYDFWKVPEFSFIFIQVLLMLIFLRLYLEIVYFQTDGFLPPSFITCAFGYQEEVIYKIMKFIIFLGFISVLPLLKISLFFMTLIVVWMAAYVMMIGVEARPLGQIIYLEALSLVIPLMFFLLSFLR